MVLTRGASKWLCVLLVVFVSARSRAQAPEDAPGADIVGGWSGVIKLPTGALDIAVRFALLDGSLSGEIDIPQQGAMGLALAQIGVEGERVRFAIKDVPGDPKFDGRIDGDAIAGSFSQGGVALTFELKRGQLPERRRPQEPKEPFPYRTETVRAAHGEVTLSGTLSLPNGAGPFPAVILISGSGPQNRDEEIFGHRPFAVLADHLARAGIAVARYDDRGVGESTGDRANATAADFANDAEAWLGVLKDRAEVGAVGLIGHSEGGMVAPIVAARNPGVAFVVLLAAPGMPGADVLVEQNRALALSSGVPRERAAAIAERARELFEGVRKAEDDATLRKRLLALMQSQGADGAPAAMEAAAEAELGKLRSAWMRSFLFDDPRDVLRRVRVPVLALNGQKDVQVVASQNLPEVERALKDGGCTDVTARELPGLNHLFQPCETGGVEEYVAIETTIDPAALDAVRDWILARYPAR